MSVGRGGRHSEYRRLGQGWKNLDQGREMPKPTRESLWSARKDLPENPYSKNDLERIVRTIE